VIAAIEGPENPFVTLTERTIIYPIYEKHVTKDPFFTIYEYFRKTLFKEQIVIVIGYSFRDFTINNAFSDWLAFKPESRLIVIAKKRNHEIIKRIIENNRVEFVDGHFRENGFISSLEDTLKNHHGKE
jgi:SIR2-like protein